MNYIIALYVIGDKYLQKCRFEKNGTQDQGKFKKKNIYLSCCAEHSSIQTWWSQLLGGNWDHSVEIKQKKRQEISSLLLDTD